MHSQIYNHFRDLNISANKLCVDPTEIWCLDNFLPQPLYDEIINQMSAIPESEWSTFVNGTSSRSECINFKGAPLIETLSSSFNSHHAVTWIQKQINCGGLIPDPHLTGGGICKIPNGYNLELHTDFNWHDDLKLNRKVNLLFFLNERWQDSWGGSLEFWNKERTERIQKISPEPNRLLFWIYEPDLAHGVPDIICAPDNISRNNLVLLYYTSNSGWDHEPHKGSRVIIT